MKPVNASIPKERKKLKTCVVTTGSARFDSTIKGFVKKHFDSERSAADWLTFPGGARALLKDRGRDFILDCIEYSIHVHHVPMVMLHITATEGETQEDSVQVLKEIKALIRSRNRMENIPLEFAIIGEEGLYPVKI